MTTKTITITPNYNAIFARFNADAKALMLRLATPDLRSYSRKEVYDFIASFRIAFGAMTSTEELDTLRDTFDKGAEAIFAQLNKEQLEEDLQPEPGDKFRFLVSGRTERIDHVDESGATGRVRRIHLVKSLNSFNVADLEFVDDAWQLKGN